MATVLIVDDEKNIRRTLRMVLEGAGFATVEAGSAEEGLATIQRDLGRTPEALESAKRLLSLRPGDPAARALVRELEAR